MDFSWSMLIDLGIISCALLIATLLRQRVTFVKKYRIPNSITAGFLLLPFYNYLAPGLGIGTGGLGNLVFHLLNLSFIAMSLRVMEKSSSGRGVFSTTIAILSQYSIQSLLGLGITFLFIASIIPNLFPSFGLLITLGFALGPGQAFSIGTGWEKLGFDGGGNVGLTFAAIGFLWACFGGMYLINRAVRKGWIHPAEGGEGIIPENAARTEKSSKRESEAMKDPRNVPGGIPVDVQGHVTGHVPRGMTTPEVMDPLSYSIALVFVIYLITYLLLKLVTYGLIFAGSMGKDFADGLWGIAFIFAAMIATLAKRFLVKTGALSEEDNQRLTRIAGTSIDIMVSASIAAISIIVVVQYWLPIAVLSLLGGAVTMVSVLWLSSRLFSDYIFHRTILIYGAMTGTLPTGLALLRVIDPEFKTPASSDYMYAVGLVFVFAIPFIFSMNFPAYGFTYGKPFYYWITFLLYALYLVFVLIAFRFIVGRKAFSKAGRIWKG
jgi:ESS family glutamate:Na+ symporter